MSDAAKNVLETSLPQALSERYLSYALSTILSRSLPDVRDGLKPVHRRLLYAMRLLKLQPTNMPKKCARVVGDVMGKFHPHGDSAIYEALVRLAQDFSVRYPLIEGHGNFGNIDGDNAAAARYTEARLTPFAEALMENIDDDTVDFRPTYDGETEEPIVFPAAFPNLLANGASGIAVGMATNIPPHNALELCAALDHMIKHPDCSDASLMGFVQGPDFPTGGLLVESPESMALSYLAGRGSFRLRAKWEVEPGKSGQYQVVITQIPYQVPKSRMIEKIADLWHEKRLPLLGDIRDESAEDLRIVLEPKSRSVDPDMLMESLFKLTDLEIRFSLNLNVVDSRGVPRVMSLKQVLQEYIDHRFVVLGRRIRNRLGQIERRLEILQGYLIAYLNMDEVIRIIREEDEPEQVLMRQFSLTSTQVEAILNMRLRALRKLEEISIRTELDQLTAEHQDLTQTLGDESLQRKKIREQVSALRKLLEKDTIHGPRRTLLTVAPVVADIPTDALIEREAITVICSKMGWIRAVKGQALTDVKYKEGDEARFILPCMTTDRILIVTSQGRSFTVLADRITRGRGHGDPLSLVIDLGPEDQIVHMAPYRGEGHQLLIIGSDHRGFRIQETDMLAQTKSGRQIYNASEGSTLRLCLMITGDHVAIIGQNRKLLIFPTEEIPIMSRGRGVILQKYKDGGLSDLRFISLTEGLVWAAGERTRTQTDLSPWLGHRGQVGRMPPVGFPRSNTF